MDKTGLEALIAEVGNFDISGYTDESVVKYRAIIEAAIAEAEQILNSESVAQADVDSAIATLRAAYESAQSGLVTIESVREELAQGVEAVQQNVKEENIYTAESWAAYQSALEDVQAVLADANITKAEAETALAALKNAADALVEKQVLVDKRMLKTWIAKVETTLNSGQAFTAESRETAENALNAAKEVDARVDATIYEVNDASIALMNAFLGLDDGVENAGLAQAIKTVQELLADTETGKNYTSESIKNLEDTLKAAEAVYADSNASQEAVNQATNELIDAITQLLEKDFSYLAALIGQAEEILKNEARYTPSSIEKLKETVAAAKQLVEDKNSDTPEIDDAYEQILEAIANLQLRGNKAELESVLKKAEEILGQSDKYLAPTLEGLQEAYDNAKSVYDDADAVQNEITEVVVELIRECMEARLLGDVDMNGTVDKADSALMLRYSAELTELTEEQILVGDVNGDGETDTADASKVLELASGKIETF